MPLNMAYCRFQNTLEALRECADWLNDHEPGELSESEEEAYGGLLRLCKRLGVDAPEEG